MNKEYVSGTFCIDIKCPQHSALEGLTGSDYMQKKNLHCKDCFAWRFFIWTKNNKWRIVQAQQDISNKQQKILRSHGNIMDEAGKGKTDRAACLSSTAGEQPDAQMMQKEREAKVQICIEKLEDEYREVLALRDIQGFSYEEICAILKIPEGTVKSRLSRARGALKDCLVKVIGDL